MQERLSLQSAEASLTYTGGSSGSGSGTPGADGKDGASAYQVAVNNGFVGSEAEWLASLVGPTGAQGSPGETGTDGTTAYESAVAGGYSGTETDFQTDLAAVDGLEAAITAIVGS